MLYVTHDQVEAMTLGDRVAVLDQGVLQQVAPPADLYARPANVFVASFIGNPPMNVFPARLDAAGGDVVLHVGGQALRLPDDGRGALASRVATAGVRPEGVTLATAGLAGSVQHVEYLGHETLAHVVLAGDGAEPIRLVARLPGMRQLADGAPVRLGFDPAHLHLFAADARALA
jgi:ABC-type sugar transport system ATPase subunit